MTEDIKLLDESFKTLGIINFTGKEICNGWDVPDELLKSILPTIKILQKLRTQYQKPIYINSTYRSPSYNKAIGGASNSLHLKFNAIDFTIADKKDLHKLYLTLDSWDDKKKRGFGIGYYKNRFIHFDTRGTLGLKGARW